MWIKRSTFEALEARVNALERSVGEIEIMSRLSVQPRQERPTYYAWTHSDSSTLHVADAVRKILDHLKLKLVEQDAVPATVVLERESAKRD